ncbi:hydrolase [Vibrio sp. V27_P1S3P104]|uniref:hydrolase n=1 Tax=unclassified Vibrio TaxID=2614977 RepID=UPI00137360C4|nr:MULTISPECIES: hydrolase [unclassified Vibrio]NAW67877.1 hydrolase [Vibrio sp. V28_P6S34P95]NAX05765.1 hydrolase [Vibrio sp. V30_P3S12P165]NAX33306.1 hydrolase [Vibrio sp. V29_P1S30P107]NAX36640.1 hydrolase [Vibrio sp. V27_P1S3P104]NAX40200.1 hydrolase [Vibrio sp. V26_P1S5P106]
MHPFVAASGLQNPHLQTLLPRFIRKKARFEPTWQTLDTPDGDFLDLAWSEAPGTKKAQSKPIFILFHGLEGSFYSPYANGLMDAFAKQGWLSVMMHFRGCSGKPNHLARAYHSGETADARWVLEYLRQQFPQQPIIATGVSLGGNMLINYLADYQTDPIVTAATAISAPLDLAACSQRIEQGFSKLYCRYLLSSLKRNALKKHRLLQDTLGLSENGIQRITKLYDFDQLITAPLHGFKNAHDYYQRCSGMQRLKEIRTPTQIIHAKDDPFMTDAVIPKFSLPDNIDYRLFTNGGHVGFISGTLTQPELWLEKALPDYYAGL